MDSGFLFQSTRPRGARLFLPAFASTSQRVSIHAPAWGATHVRDSTELVQKVSIHAPAWGATNPSAKPQTGGRLFQSTRPRGARLLRTGEFHAWKRVSIHAPAWGATDKLGLEWKPFIVSIHAPAWGATDKLGLEWKPFIVSIHAPAWGATATVSHKKTS